jgi:hypothetical protein
MMTVRVDPFLLSDFVNDLKQPVPPLRLWIFNHRHLDLRDPNHVKLALCLGYVWQLAGYLHLLALGHALWHADLVSLDLEDLLGRDHLFDMRSFGGLIVLQVLRLFRASPEGVVCIDVILLPG